MNITYLNNSGFALSDANDLLIIDCYDFSPRAGSLNEGVIDAATLNAHDSVTVLVSHGHGDHYNEEIFSWRDVRPDIEYLLSSDIEAKGRAQTIAEGQSITLNGMRINAHGSTDLGVSFDISWNDRRIFHAGDFNYWHWKGDGDEEWTRAQDADFSRILNGIPAQPPIDIAMFPVDPRMGEDYYSGAVKFAHAIKPRLFIPMHFGQKFSAPDALVTGLASHTQLIGVPRRGFTIEL